MFRKGISLLLAFVLLLSGMVQISVADAAQTGTTYYIDSQLGDDTFNDGLTPGTPWKTFAKVNSTIFQPGDKILLKCNGVWNEQLHPKGAGAADNPITISSYGEGNKPVIALQGQNLEGSDTGIVANACVYLKNQSNWIIQNLETTNFSSDPRSEIYRFGIAVENFDGGIISNIQILNNTVHDVSGSFYWQDHAAVKTYEGPHCNGGIALNVRGTTGTDKFDNVLIQGNTVKNVGRTGIVVWDNGWNGPDYGSTNVKISENYVEKSDSDGILTFGCNGAILEYNVANGCGNYTEEGQFNGTCAIWSTRGADCVSQFNEAYNTQSSALNEDGEAFDIDMDSSNFVVQYNYSHDNEGGFVLIVDASGAPGIYNGTKNPVVRYNISQNDGKRVINIAGGIAENLQFYNNTIYLDKGISTNLIDHSWDIDMTRSYSFKNNVFYNLGSGSYNVPGANGTFDYNLFYGNHPSNEPSDPHKLTSNPLLQNPGSGAIGLNTVDGYMLAANSPALGSGILISNNGGRDYWGNALSAVSAPNRGAYSGTGVDPIDEKVIVIQDAINAISSLPSLEYLTLYDWYFVESARTLVTKAMQKGASDGDITNISVLAALEAKMSELKVENPMMSFTDNFDDTSKVLSYEGPLGLNIYGSFEGDTSQLYCANGASGSVIYKTTGLHDFSARFYYFTDGAIPDGNYENVIRFYVSSDNTDWVQVIPQKSEVTPIDGPDWKGITFSVPEMPENCTDANFLKVQLINNSPVSWAYLLGQVTYHVKLTNPGTFDLKGPADGAGYQAVNPLLSWNLAAGADVYRILADDNVDFSSPEIDETVDGKTKSYQAYGLSYDRTYFWKVIARNAIGNTESNLVKSFTTNPEQAVTYTDNFSDFSKIGGIIPENWAIATDSPEVYFEGDADRIVKSPDTTTGSFIYIIDDLAGANKELAAFSARAYYCSYGGPDNIQNKNIQFFVSVDDTSWTPLQAENTANVNISGAWYRTDIETDTIPAGTKYLKIEVDDREEGNWAIQIGKVILTTVPSYLQELKGVIQAISALPSVEALTLQDKAAVENARNMAATVKAKGATDAEITNLAWLLAAENKISALMSPTLPTQTPVQTTTPVTSTIGAKTVLNGSTAEGSVDMDTLLKSFEVAEQNAVGVKKVTIVPEQMKEASSYHMTLPAAIFDTPASSQDGTLKLIEIKTSVGSMDIPSDMFKKNDLDKAQNVRFTITRADSSAIDDELKSNIGTRPVIQLSVTVDGKNISWENNNTQVAVTLDYQPTAEERENPDNLVIWYINGEGKVRPVSNAKYDPSTGKITFKTSHFSTFAVAFVKKDFSDMTKFTWAKISAEMLVARGIMGQTSENKFSPDKLVTRGEFIDVLVKALDLHAEYNTNFVDVSAANQYYESVAITKELGITTGYNNRFNPDGEISRQDITVLIFKALTLCQKIKSTGGAADIAHYEDASKVANYAVNAMSTLVKEGIIKGSGKFLNPMGKATRAEVATIIYKVYKIYW